ncbi:hypothetical protein CONLIGDRAFT_719727 [Coniochaeta ligniaria NRRL 30616]|uniref:Zn(2)-C6 fungal-type domain-containing protein n=1 Tax=Coniochaeta ligniaria NRRL 30616 TaxID=1408157 RepID=A0A1J7J0K2_9PEZI|nr:hypothetical protein CONLIGDRAFT_719727 [Coniochaeta ligniaria NRRL 30616]
MFVTGQTSCHIQQHPQVMDIALVNHRTPFEMDERTAQSVLRCDRCRKPFDKLSTLKRHGYYCQSKKEITVSRSRACICCAKRKIRCDGRRPSCSKCIANAIDCQYPATTIKDKGSTSQRKDDRPIHRRCPVSPPTISSDVVEGSGRSGLENELSTPVHDLSVAGDIHLPWDDISITFAEFLNDPMNEYLVPCPSPSLSDMVRNNHNPFTDQTPSLQDTCPSPTLTIPAVPNDNVRLLIQRPKTNAGTLSIASLVFQTLKSYPLMMSRHDTLPPFIHPRVMSSGIDRNYLEPLNNCASLGHMLGAEVQGGRKLFWKVVRMECERLCEEYLQLNRWGLLAAIQALAIYIIVRMDEGQTEHNNVDHLLITTVIILSSQFSNSSVCHDDLDTSWNNWIFEESARRTCVIYQVINMLVYFQPAGLCQLEQTDILLAPLPAKKQIWEAGDESMWMAEHDRDPDAGAIFAMTASGGLVKFHVDPRKCLQDTSAVRTAASWE